MNFIRTKIAIMSWLINSILENEEILQLKPDFSRLVFIPKDIASKTQTLVFAEEKRRELSILTTNNFPEELKKSFTNSKENDIQQKYSIQHQNDLQQGLIGTIN